MFSKILIANRGEIACRIIRTARRMGIGTVAVHSDADARALHVALADEAVPIGPSPAAESYLKADHIIKAALSTGAEAIHPGYGFLSENPDFVEAVEKAGLTFIGPSAEAIRTMGLKDAAKRLMEKAGVPVVPGYHGETQALVLLAGKANEIGYPVLVKARAGGGGKGMRRVDDPDDFPAALAAARREAKSAFGDDHVLVEKYVEKPRHIEVQIFGDSHGNVVHLFERDCSAQRRHQKVIEEAPAPGMTQEMRAAMTEAAVAAARAIGYKNAGTIEFIVDSSKGLRPDGFWFMEMNTRLQVEHPVTEMVTGLDLVEWQIRVARGEPLPLTQKAITLSGHAFEARIYAEDPMRDFLPATGTLHHLVLPKGDGIRIDAGVRAGDRIPPFYDPLIAKLIAHGPDRTAALSRLAQALETTEIGGSTTNVGFLARLARNDTMVAGDVDTGLIARQQRLLTQSIEPDASDIARLVLAASDIGRSRPSSDPWSALGGYVHFNPIARTIRLDHGNRDIRASVTVTGERCAVAIEGEPHPIILPFPRPHGGPLRKHGEGPRRQGTGTVARWPGHVALFRAGHAITFAVADLEAMPGDATDSGDRVTAPMPGTVKIVRSVKGEAVKKGQPLLVLEAMKMEHTIAAPHDGVISEIAAKGAQVSDGTVLVRFEEADRTA